MRPYELQDGTGLPSCSKASMHISACIHAYLKEACSCRSTAAEAGYVTLHANAKRLAGQSAEYVPAGLLQVLAYRSATGPTARRFKLLTRNPKETLIVGQG